MSIGHMLLFKTHRSFSFEKTPTPKWAFELPNKIQWYIAAASGLRICEDLDMFWTSWMGSLSSLDVMIFLVHDHQLQPSYSTMATSASTQSIILKVDST